MNSAKSGSFEDKIVLYSDADGEIKLDVSFENDTVWLSQKQIEILFAIDQSGISRHLKNIFKEGELDKESNMQKMHIANSDKPVEFYNLDVILSVGYRVNSKRATEFRKWATGILKEYLIHGYAINQQRLSKKGLDELTATMELVRNSIEAKEISSDEAGRSI